MDEEKKSVHRRFIEFLMGYDFRVKDGNLVNWAGSHWASLPLPEKEAPTLSAFRTMDDFVRNCRSSKRLAIEWLWSLGSTEASKRDSFAGDLADKILASALMKLPPAPKPSKNPIIPCLNGWLEVLPATGASASGGSRPRLAVRQPDKEIGVFHVLDVVLPPGISVYEPQPVPLESEFSQFIRAVQPDPIQRQAVQEFCGYVLTANDSATEQKHQFWMGSDDGRNGKGTMLDLLMGFLSKDAWTAYNLAKIDDKFANAALAGKALVIVDETPKAIKSPGQLKSMLGEGVIVMERKFKDPESIQLRSRWIFLSNHWPKATEGDRALWNRFQFIEWPVEISETKKKAGLAASLLQNEKGILFDFFMAGILSYLERGRLMDLASSNAIRKAVVLSGDPVAEWLEESGAFLSLTTTAPKDEIYEDFFERARRQGHPTPLGATGFWPRIKALLKKNGDPSQQNLLEPPRSGRGGDRRQRSNLILPKHSPDEARIRDGEAPEPCPFAPAPAAPGEAEKAALQRWKEANPQGAEGSYRPEWDALLPHAKALFREAVAEGVGRAEIAARMAAKIRLLGGCPPAEMEAARHGFVETLLD